MGTGLHFKDGANTIAFEAGLLLGHLLSYDRIGLKAKLLVPSNLLCFSVSFEMGRSIKTALSNNNADMPGV